MGGLGGDGGDVFLELDCVEVDQRLKGELGVRDVEVRVYQVLYFFPVVLLQVVVSQGDHNGHGAFEGLY